MRIAYHVMSAPGPLGLLFLARSDQGLRHLEFLDKRSIKRTIESHRSTHPDAVWEASLIDLKDAVDQLEGYFCGALTKFELALDPQGSEFETAVWRELLEIPYGETRTYGQIAKSVGQPKGSRAVGLANNSNPIAIVIPCHRVIGANGDLTGYGGGLPRKKWLLAHEAHFGALAGVTLDLFAATGSLPNTRIASGDGPPLGTQRRTASLVRAEQRTAAAAVAAKAASKAPAKAVVARAVVGKAVVAKPSGAKTVTAKSPSRASRPAARALPKTRSAASRTGTKPAARASRTTPRRTAR